MYLSGIPTRIWSIGKVWKLKRNVFAKLLYASSKSLRERIFVLYETYKETPTSYFLFKFKFLLWNEYEWWNNIMCNKYDWYLKNEKWKKKVLNWKWMALEIKFVKPKLTTNELVSYIVSLIIIKISSSSSTSSP